MSNSHPEFDGNTSGTEVASAFASQIKGKNGEMTRIPRYTTSRNPDTLLQWLSPVLVLTVWERASL
jgi:hypothetical protein